MSAVAVVAGNGTPAAAAAVVSAEEKCEKNVVMSMRVNGDPATCADSSKLSDVPASDEVWDGAGDAQNGSDDALLREAAELYARAEASVAKGLPKCNDWFCARDFFNEAGAIYASAGRPQEAAKAFLSASVITHTFKSEDETVLALSLAADNLQVAQPALAVDVLNSLSTVFRNGGHKIQAARCKREAALLLDHVLSEPVKAIQMYKDAMELYGDREFVKSFTRGCMARICALTVGLRNYTEAYRLYMEEAKMIHRQFPKTKQYLYAMLCLLAEGYGNADRYFDALYVTRKRFDALQEEEINLQQGKEHQLMRQIIAANDHGSLNEFDVAVFTYKSCSTYLQDPVFDVLVEQCRSNLYEHVELYM